MKKLERFEGKVVRNCSFKLFVYYNNYNIIVGGGGGGGGGGGIFYRIFIGEITRKKNLNSSHLKAKKLYFLVSMF